MKCVRKTQAGPGFVELGNAPVPVPGDDEILVKVRAAAICGTDVHIRGWDEWSRKRLRPPVIIGHEFCGEIVETGKAVKHLRPGDIVVPESHVPCKVCPDCRAGNLHVCQKTGLVGVTRDGGFADYAVFPAEIAYKDELGLSYRCLSILEPFGQAVHAVMDFPVGGKTVAIIGCGPIGLMCVQVARHVGAGRIIAVELNEARGAQALSLGADDWVNPIASDPVDRIMELTRGIGVDIAIDMSGSVIAEEQATRYIRPEGKFVVAGLPDKPFSFNLAEFAFKGITLHGAPARLLYRTWEQIDALLRQGIDPSVVVTHELPLTDFAQGLDMMEKGECGKCLLIP